jgi:hypothetical protein
VDPLDAAITVEVDQDDRSRDIVEGCALGSDTNADTNRRENQYRSVHFDGRLRFGVQVDAAVCRSLA